jgi:UDP-N-acetylglucosamine 1-carboxyvinyltransferase
MSELHRLVVRGGTPVDGTIDIRGSKNALPKVMVASMLSDQVSRIGNVSWIRDTHVVTELVEEFGGHVRTVDGCLELECRDFRLVPNEAMDVYHQRSRVPILTAAVSLHRCGYAWVSGPGGCSIGPRPVDFHLAVLEMFGAAREDGPAGIELKAPAGGLRGARVNLSYPSVGATEQFLLAAVLAEGDSELSNAAIEPEILDLISVLQKMGGIISVGSNRAITVTGVDRLTGFHHDVIPDRLEAASWASLALATAGRVTLRDVRQADMATFLNMFRRAGGGFDIAARGDSITFWREREMLRPLAFETDVHPGFMTDWQSPFVTALTQAAGVSVVHETVYEDRLGYTDALRQLGADIQVFTECLGSTRCRFGVANHRHSAVVVGPANLRGAHLVVPDLRAGFSYVIAAAAASGTSTIDGIELLDRGYEEFTGKLEALGVQIQ